MWEDPYKRMAAGVGGGGGIKKDLSEVVVGELSPEV